MRVRVDIHFTVNDPVQPLDKNGNNPVHTKSILHTTSEEEAVNVFLVTLRTETNIKEVTIISTETYE